MITYLFQDFGKWQQNIIELQLENTIVHFLRNFFLKSLQELVPNIKNEDLEKGPSGVRAQALGYDGSLIDDFVIHKKKNMIHVINAPSPAATSSFSIGRELLNYILKLLSSFYNIKCNS